MNLIIMMSSKSSNHSPKMRLWKSLIEKKLGLDPRCHISGTCTVSYTQWKKGCIHIWNVEVLWWSHPSGWKQYLTFPLRAIVSMTLDKYNLYSSTVEHGGKFSSLKRSQLVLHPACVHLDAFILLWLFWLLLGHFLKFFDGTQGKLIKREPSELPTSGLPTGWQFWVYPLTQDCQPQLWYILYTIILVLMLSNHPDIDMLVDNANIDTIRRSRIWRKAICLDCYGSWQDIMFFMFVY